MLNKNIFCGFREVVRPTRLPHKMQGAISEGTLGWDSRVLIHSAGQLVASGLAIGNDGHMHCTLETVRHEMQMAPVYPRMPLQGCMLIVRHLTIRNFRPVEAASFARGVKTLITGWQAAARYLQ